MIFSSRSPIDRTSGDKPKLRLLPVKEAKSKLKALVDRVSPLICARTDVDKAHADGYFANHYPDADKLLKTLLHDEVMTAWSRAASKKEEPEESEEEEKEEHKGLKIQISICA